MIGPQRLSLLDGEVLRRRYSARDSFDQLLDKLVDAFDFKIDTTPEPEVRRHSCIAAFPKHTSEAYTSVTEETAAARPWSLKKAWTFPSTKNQSVAALVNETLCAWILNASPDGEKSNPLELGWSTRKEAAPEYDDDLVFHMDDKEELPLECGYTYMTC